MQMKLLLRAAIIIIFTTLNSHAIAGTSCEGLINIRLDDTIITKSELITAGSLAMGDKTYQVPHICRVAATISPAINLEVWLPVAKEWNGRFLQVGGGGLAGRINYHRLTEAVNGGYVTSSTDTGHVSGDLSWMKDRGLVEDYGHRAVHETAVRTKAILAAFYGRSQDYAYFKGCSTGGRQALMEAQRYPYDFNGIVAGAPVNNFARLLTGQLWHAHARLIKNGSQLYPVDFSMITAAVMKKCDDNDGVIDGMLTDPRTCDFNPAALLCEGENKEHCLSPTQVTALNLIYQGATNPRTGVQIYPGPEMGGEGIKEKFSGWANIMRDKPPRLAMTSLKGLGFENDNYPWQNFDFDQDVDTLIAKFSLNLMATNPDLIDFEGRGGKLIMYHGWNDAGVPPRNTINYLESINRYWKNATNSANSHEETANYARLYMMPGMGHCSGGVGPDEVDYMSAIVDWVEKGKAPEDLISTKIVDGDETMSRPICPYPQKAVYNGSGDSNKSDNFKCH